MLAALCALLVCLPATFLALLFSFVVEDYGVSREGASWPMNVFTMAMQLAGLLISLLQRRISVANLIALSCFISSLGITASAFTRNVTGLTVTIGIIYGSGMGMFITSVLVFNLRLFDKYKGTAIGFTFIAWAAGGMFGPAVFSYLRATYGFNGALLLTGGMMLHSVPVSLLLRNPDFKTPRCLRSLKTRLSAMTFGQTMASGVNKKSIPQESCSEASALFHNESISRGTTKISNPLLGRAQEKLPSSEVTRESTEAPLQAPKGPIQTNGVLPHGEPRKVSKAAMSVFKSPGFYVCMFATVVGEYSLVSLGTTIVDFAVGRGIPLNVAMNLVTCTSVGHLVGRLLIVPLSDLAPAARWPLYAGSYALEAVCTLVLPYLGYIGGLLVLRVAESASQGFAASIRGILLAQLLSVEVVPFCTGVFGVVMVPIWLSNPHIIGFFRDGMGSYDEFYRLLGAVNIVAAVTTCAFFVFNWKSLQPKRRCDLVVAEQDESANAS